MVHRTLVSLVAKTTDTVVLKQAAYSPKGLYKFLLRQCNRLPHKEISLYYKHHVRQSFNQHADESDPERVVQIINQAVKDFDWVLKKCWTMEPPSLKVVENGDSFTAQTPVSSVCKFFHALSTFASRPELLISHIRSTDIDWDSLDPSLRTCYNNHACNNIFEFMYSPIYHHKKCCPSSGAGELRGTLHDETIKSWVDQEKSISLSRIVHHKPLKDEKFGWSSTVEETWDFKEYLVKLVSKPIHDSKPFPYVPFVTLHAAYSVKEKTATLTISHFQGSLVPEADDGMVFYKTVFLPKLVEWLSDEYVATPPTLTRLRARPHSYINNQLYWLCYDHLKSGPAEEIKLIWEESTDPVKFIHEDIGIASYIVSFILTESQKYLPVHNREHIEVIDLGCGNGLLCYFIAQLLPLFSKVGSVLGFDIRMRKIWKKLVDRFSQTEYKFSGNREPTLPFQTDVGEISFNLTERTFVPHKIDDLIATYACSDEERQSRSLWIIGNHSDELTPWIPVVSRRLNANGFFNIPCCPYDFFGKYQRHANVPGSSTYHNYIEYICTVGDNFGYLPTLDKLRIPSTKNICLIGLNCSRQFEGDVLSSEVDSILQKLKDGDKGNTFSKFVPRSKESGAKAPQFDRAVGEAIVSKIFQLLISNWKAPTGCESEKQQWYGGREDLTFKEIYTVLTQPERNMLKGKGNGLKTLISCNRHLFTVHDFQVKLRVPNEGDVNNVSETHRDRIRTRPCYFHLHHPQGCPLSNELCTHKH